MRNIFHQYNQNENRLTHALVSALAEDKGLCRDFVIWATGKKNPPSSIHLLEQQLVGEDELSEDEAEKRGLPDAWLHDDDSWSLLLESKVAASLTKDQLVRHYNTASRRGFDDITVLALCVKSQKLSLPDYVICRTWSECYSWLKRQSKKSTWAARVAHYFEAAEAAWAAEGYLTEGTLTVFTGIPFTNQYPYNYREAKLYLRQAMDELRQRKDIARKLSIAPDMRGRGAITGRSGTGVWDVIQLRQTHGAGNFTTYPHLTFGLNRDQVAAIVVVPNGLKTPLRKNLLNLGEDGFIDMMSEINKNFAPLLKIPDVAPVASLVQRRFISRRGPSVTDASLEFDLRTAFSSGSRSKVRVQPEWIKAAYQALSNRKSNMAFSVGMRFPYRDGSITNDVRVLDRVSEAWIACKPLIDCILGSSSKS